MAFDAPAAAAADSWLPQQLCSQDSCAAPPTPNAQPCPCPAQGGRDLLTAAASDHGSLRSASMLPASPFQSAPKRACTRQAHSPTSLPALSPFALQRRRSGLASPFASARDSLSLEPPKEPASGSVGSPVLPPPPEVTAAAAVAAYRQQQQQQQQLAELRPSPFQTCQAQSYLRQPSALSDPGSLTLSLSLSELSPCLSPGESGLVRSPLSSSLNSSGLNCSLSGAAADASGGLPGSAASWASAAASSCSSGEMELEPGASACQPADLPPFELPAGLEEWLVPCADVEILTRPGSAGELWQIGEGASARVYKALLRGELVAAKQVDLRRSQEARTAFVEEASRLALLRHASVVSFYGLSVDEAAGTGTLLLELCAGRDLHAALRLRSARTGRRLFGWYRHGCRVALEVATALNYLHSKGVVHMDVKSSNVLLTSSGGARLADLGISCLQSHAVPSMLPVAGTWSWVAPEVLIGANHCTNAVDMFSFGVLLWEIITGERPVRGRMRTPCVPAECPQEAVDLMAACGSLDPAARPTAQQAMAALAAMLEARGGCKPVAGSA